MRRVRLFIATSLDGYIAGRDDDLGWRFDDADYGYAAFYQSIDTVLVGRRTYEVAQSLAEWPYAGRRVVVFTRAGEARVTSPDTVATPRPPADIVAELRARPGKDLWLVGGGALVNSFMAAGLIDDVIVSIHPVLLGDGIPLVGRGAPRMPLALVGERRYPSGLMQLTYRADRA
jgi:dihydrofolate reductase